MTKCGGFVLSEEEANFMMLFVANGNPMPFWALDWRSMRIGWIYGGFVDTLESFQTMSGWLVGLAEGFGQ